MTMLTAKTHTPAGKGKEPSFTKRQVKSSSFKEKIEKANELLSAPVLLKKKK